MAIKIAILCKENIEQEILIKIANTNHAYQYTCNSMPFDICQMKDVDVTYYSVLSV